ncbi:unnamed protein product [Heterobilharzia americana]|nr:unnamed protein product [Heterobilharzia americana]CAH8617940.1 unnamed protein product [Heterobilharzia americana]
MNFSGYPFSISAPVDSYYCPNCLENMASAEAKMRKHRCGNCFDCPSCGHTLSTRATAVVHAKPDEPGRTTAQKAYFLACGFCRWITRDSGIPDQQQAAGGWQEKTSPHFKRISELIDSYHHLAVQEKEDQEWNKFARKRNYMILLERYPVLNPRLRRYCSSSWTTPNRESGPTKKVVIPSAEAFSEVPPFDLDEYINKPLNIDKITNIRQRHLAPQVQPRYKSQLEPRPKNLVVKRSMRCRVCEHNLCKADFNPSSIKFRINLSAIYHVPELRYMILPPSTPQPSSSSTTSTAELTTGKIDLTLQRRTSTTLVAMRCEPVIHSNAAPGQKLNMILTISNPMHRVTTVSLRQLSPSEELHHLGHLISNNHEIRPKPSSSSIVKKVESLSVGDKTDSTGELQVKPSGDTSSSDEPESCFSTVNLILPNEELKLAPRNDIMDCDVSSGQSSVDNKDDPKIVAFRRGNKLGINITLIPKTDKIRTPQNSSLAPVIEDQEVDVHPTPTEEMIPLRAAVYLNYDYKNTSTTLLTAATSKASDSKTPDKPSETASCETPAAVERPAPSADEIKQIQLIALLDFGHMPVKK